MKYIQSLTSYPRIQRDGQCEDYYFENHEFLLFDQLVLFEIRQVTNENTTLGEINFTALKYFSL